MVIDTKFEVRFPYDPTHGRSENGCYPMCQIECRQNLLYVRLALPGGVPIQCHEVPASQVFKN